MKKELFKVIEMDKFEYGLIINALNELRNQCIKEGKTYFKRKGYIDAR